MEIIKELPEVFEEFSEQRRNSFLSVKEIKESGTPVIGAYCTFSAGSCYGGRGSADRPMFYVG